MATIFYTYLSFSISANSDNMSSLIIAKDIASGNIRLNGWSLSTQSYIFSDIIWSALAIRLFGYHYLMVHILPAFMYSITLILLILLAVRENKYGWLWLLPTVIIPTVFSGSVSFELNIHGGIYLFSALILFFLEKKQNNISTLSSILLSIACGLLIDSDKLFLYILIIPLFAASALHYLLSKEKKYLLISAMSIGSICIYKLYPVIADEFFLYEVPGIQPPEIANFETFKINILLFIDGIKHLFGLVDNTSIPSMLFVYFNLLFLTLFIATTLYCIFKYSCKNLMNSFLVLSSCISVSAFIFSNAPTDYASARYFYSALPFCSLLISRNIRLNSSALVSLLIITFICSAGNLYAFSKIEPSTKYFYRNLSNFLADKGLKYGYAPYWEASVLSGHDKQSVIPVDVSDYITPQHWLSKRQDYETERNFFMSSNKKDIEIAINQFGKPEYQYNFGDMIIVKWEKIQLPPLGIVFHKIPATMKTQVGKINNGEISSNGNAGYLIYGPYVSLNKGKYTLIVNGANSSIGDSIEVIDNSSASTIFTSALNFNEDGIFKANFEIPTKAGDIEVRIKTEDNPNLVLNGYALTSK